MLITIWIQSLCDSKQLEMLRSWNRTFTRSPPPIGFRRLYSFWGKSLRGRPAIHSWATFHWYSYYKYAEHNQFTYINLAFSPAPDDTVSNLYKVRVLYDHESPSVKLNPQSVICHGRSSNSKLQVRSLYILFNLNSHLTTDHRSTTAAWG